MFAATLRQGYDPKGMIQNWGTAASRYLKHESVLELLHACRQAAVQDGPRNEVHLRILHLLPASPTLWVSTFQGQCDDYTSGGFNSAVVGPRPNGTPITDCGAEAVPAA